MKLDPASFPWESAIRARALAAGLELSASSASGIAAHARAVLAANEHLHLTTVLDPGAFLERHIGEAFEGAALVPTLTDGVIVDLGSGNGYPGIPIAVARPGLAPILIESSAKKSAFLREALRMARCERGHVHERNVARAADLGAIPPIDVLVTRAMGGWERIVPRLVSRLSPEAIVLIWSTTESETIMKRIAWKALRVVARRKVPGRDRSVIYQFTPQRSI